MRSRTVLFTFLILTLLAPHPVRAAAAVDVSDNRAILNFPDSITFHARIQSSATITEIVLEYGDQEQTCGTVIAKAYPQFTSAASVTAEWTWEMKQSGSRPPGAVIWWRWRITDAGGQETVTDAETVTWLDNQHNWQTLTSSMIRLHWYKGDQTFSSDLLNAATEGLSRLEREAGLKADQPIDLYIYASTNDLKDAILYEPGWTGGQAFPENNIVIIGIAPSDLDWGRRAEVHELTHVLVGHLTFSCLGDVPTWLNEGLAVYSEGDLDSYSQSQLNNAIRSDALLSVRSLSGGFSEVADKANLSYSESYSIVKFLIEAYGQDRMTTLLLTLRDGTTIDAALTQVYGFDVDGLEDAWRASIGARPRPAAPNPNSCPPTSTNTSSNPSLLMSPTTGMSKYGSPLAKGCDHAMFPSCRYTSNRAALPSELPGSTRRISAKPSRSRSATVTSRQSLVE